MKKLERRAILFLLLAAALVAGLCLFMYRYITQGDDWVTQPYNTHLYSNGTQVAGTIYDVTGEMLISGEGNKVLRERLTEIGYEVVESELKSNFNPTDEILKEARKIAEELVK